MPATAMHNAMPSNVGIITETAVHFQDPVSFFMVQTVVEQGQWNRQKIIIQTAVRGVQPWAARRLSSEEGSDISTRAPD